jgi:hypothetical protein
MDEENKRRFDALMKLADFRRERQANRRQHEWKVTVGLWALLAAGIAYPPKCPIWALVFALIVVVIAHAFLWVRWVWVGSTKDAKLAFFYAEHAEKMALPGSPDPEQRFEMDLCRELFGFLGEAGCWFQIIATILLAFGVGLKAASI